jgi:hypothetical protein
VKLLPLTATAVCCTRLLFASVNQGVTELVLRFDKLNVWLEAELLLLMATMTNFVGLAPEAAFL